RREAAAAEFRPAVVHIDTGVGVIADRAGLHLEVQMGTGRIPGLAHIADGLPGTDRRTVADTECTQMAVVGVHAAAVVDHDPVTGPAGNHVPTASHHGACGRRVHGRAGGIG